MPSVMNAGQVRAELLLSRGEITPDEHETIMLMIAEFKFLNRMLHSPGREVLFIISKSEFMDIILSDLADRMSTAELVWVSFKEFPLTFREYPSLKECEATLNRLIVLLRKVFPSYFLLTPNICFYGIEIHGTGLININLLDFDTLGGNLLLKEETALRLRIFCSSVLYTNRGVGNRISNYIYLVTAKPSLSVIDSLQAALEQAHTMDVIAAIETELGTLMSI